MNNNANFFVAVKIIYHILQVHIKWNLHCVQYKYTYHCHHAHHATLLMNLHVIHFNVPIIIAYCSILIHIYDFSMWDPVYFKNLSCKTLVSSLSLIAWIPGWFTAFRIRVITSITIITVTILHCVWVLRQCGGWWEWRLCWMDRQTYISYKMPSMVNRWGVTFQIKMLLQIC